MKATKYMCEKIDDKLYFKYQRCTCRCVNVIKEGIMGTVKLCFDPSFVREGMA
jgi:hypothetical protein